MVYAKAPHVHAGLRIHTTFHMRLRIGLSVLLIISVAGCAKPPHRRRCPWPSIQSLAFPSRWANSAATPPTWVANTGPAIPSNHHRSRENYLLVQLPGSARIEARLAAANFETLMLPEHRAEVQALAQAVGINHYDAVLAQCFLDLTPSTNCSTIPCLRKLHPDGVARFGETWTSHPSESSTSTRHFSSIIRPGGTPSRRSAGRE